MDWRLADDNFGSSEGNRDFLAETESVKSKRIRFLYDKRLPFVYQSCYYLYVASNPVLNIRLRPVIIAYLDELGGLGGYGKGRSGVARRFIENGIVRALEQKVIDKNNAVQFGEANGDDPEDYE